MMYVLLIHRALPPDDPRSVAQDQPTLRRHRALQKEARGDLRAVARLDEPSAAKTVRKRADGFAVTDGPYLETKEWLVGFYLVECAGEAEAIARAEQICQDDGSVEIRPVTWHRTP